MANPNVTVDRSSTRAKRSPKLRISDNLQTGKEEPQTTPENLQTGEEEPLTNTHTATRHETTKKYKISSAPVQTIAGLEPIKHGIAFQSAPLYVSTPPTRSVS